MRLRGVTSGGLFLLLSTALVGCASRGEKVTLTASGEPDYHKLHIVYETSSEFGLKKTSSSTIERAGHVADDDPNGDGDGDNNGDGIAAKNFRVRLDIQYPHPDPDAHADFARAVLRVISKSPSAAKAAESKAPVTDYNSDTESFFAPSLSRKKAEDSDPNADGLVEDQDDKPAKVDTSKMEQALVIDLPKSQLDSLLYELAKAGFFDGKGKASGDSHLDVTYNKALVEKRWGHEPRLEDFIDLVRRHGKVAVVKAPAAD